MNTVAIVIRMQIIRNNFYWSEQCGLKVYTQDEFIRRLDEFIAKLPSYTPVAFVQQNLTDRVCFQRFLDALNLKIQI
jgi:hypothetical protein